MGVNRVSEKSSSNDAVGKEFELRVTPLRRVQMTLHRYPWLSSLVVLLSVVIAFGIVNVVVVVHETTLLLQLFVLL